MQKKNELLFENIIIGYYDSYSGINSCIGVLTSSGEVWKFDFDEFFVGDISNEISFGGLECDDIKECINKGFFLFHKKWKTEWINYLEYHLSSISNWNINTSPNEIPCCGGEMIRYIFARKEERIFGLGTLSASYNKIYSFIDDSNVRGILNRFITDWTIFW